MKQLPRILIFSRPFNYSTGGGITLTNLFKGWPVEKIAGIYVAYGNEILTTDICKTYYQLGEEEHKWEFPFNILKRTYPSGLRSATNKIDKPDSTAKKGLKLLASHYLEEILKWFGFSHCISKITLSPRLKEWFSEYQPEVLYMQVSTREGIAFADLLVDYLKIPSAIHMMDDWPSTISENGLFKNFWKDRIDREFRQLLDKIDLHLSISDAMSEEYLKRYQKKFTAFHNPVEISGYTMKSKRGIRKNAFQVLYVGRIGTANKDSIVFFATIMSQLSSEKHRIEMDIYTKDIDLPSLKMLSNYKNVTIHPPVPHDLIPELLMEYDLLLLPLNFTESGLRFAKFSIPTKASEYMLSGTPILVFAPAETAISSFFAQNNCGYCVTDQIRAEIEKALKLLINNKEYGERISRNALNLARAKFDAGVVRARFQSILSDIF